jgi:ABC-type enterochelin transport system substrate-binding protein
MTVSLRRKIMKKTTKIPTRRKSKSQKQIKDFDLLKQIKEQTEEQINEMYPDEYYSRQGRVDSFLIATTCVWAMAAIGMGMLIYLFIFE